MKTIKTIENDPAGNICLSFRIEDVPFVFNKIVSVARVKRGTSPSEVIKAVAAAAGVTPGAMLTDWQAAHVARPRQVAMLIIREACPYLSLPSIAAIFDRDHSTVIYGIRRARKIIAEHPDWDKVYWDARQELGLE